MRHNMKKRNRTLWLTVILTTLFILSFSCQKAEPPQPETKFNAATYDENAQNLAQAVSRTLAASGDFRRIIRHEAMKQVDGDYDVLLGHIVDKRMSEYNPVLKKSVSDTRIGDLLESNLKPGRTIMLKSTSSVIDDMLKANPDLQVSIPVHCEDWDPETFTPNVAVVGSDYRDGKTKTVKAYTPDGTVIDISAIEEPTEPVVVVSLNERNLQAILPIGGTTIPSTPTDLSGVVTESGIRLTWNMPSTSNTTNTTGYYIYRKGALETGYKKIGTSYGYYNKSYNDNDLEPSRSYSYYVMAYYGSVLSSSSNIISITAPAKPKPVQSFDAIQVSNTRVELRWQNDYSQSFNSTEIYRYRQGIDADYRLLRSFSPAYHYLLRR